jgi:hypothetical protein
MLSTNCATILRASQLKMFIEIITVYTEDHTKHIQNTVSEYRTLRHVHQTRDFELKVHVIFTSRCVNSTKITSV